jgi:hypothetical protein
MDMNELGFFVYMSELEEQEKVNVELYLNCVAEQTTQEQEEDKS